MSQPEKYLERAAIIYDSGPRFEAMNQINREAWVNKIAKALYDVEVETVERCAKIVDDTDWRQGRSRQAIKDGIIEAIRGGMEK